jgi:hypothetical protein
LHTKPQLAPSHVAVAFAGGVHGAHDAPQESTLVVLAHDEPHW